MKKTIAVLLCLCLLLAGAVPATAAGKQNNAVNTALLCVEDFLFQMTERLRGLFGCREAEQPFPKAKVTAETLLLLDTPRGDAALALGSLQGVLANVSQTQLAFKDGAYRTYLADAPVEIEERTGERAEAAALLKEFADCVNGYVLCDEAGAQAAVSVAGVLRAVVIPESLQDAAKAAGLTCREDARGWTDKTLRRSRYFTKLNRSVAFSQPVSLAPKLVDYAVMAGAYFGFSDSAEEKDCKRLYSFLDDNAVVFGWNAVLGEYGTVAALSACNACLIPADHACNLSVLSGFPSVDQKQTAAAQPEARAGHTVCLFLSDGDNLQWMLTQFTGAAHFGSPLRGEFPMGWGVPASLNDTAPTMAQRLYADAAPNDEFILQISGLGYTFPSRWKDPFALRRMYGALSQKMARADLRIAAVLDDGGFYHRALDVLAAQENVSGVFYLDYDNYAGMDGAARLSHGKPIIGARYKLWYGQPGGSPEEIAAAVNAASKDPADPDAYSLIVAHAWSGLDAEGDFAGYGDTMAAVRRLVDLFDGDVRLASPTEFAALVKETLG